jgi:hypothetical protein
MCVNTHSLKHVHTNLEVFGTGDSKHGVNNGVEAWLQEDWFGVSNLHDQFQCALSLRLPLGSQYRLDSLP